MSQKPIIIDKRPRSVEVVPRDTCRGDRMAFFRDIKATVSALHTGERRARLEAWADQGIANQSDESRANDLVLLREAAANPTANPEAFDAYCAMTTTAVDNFVRATSNAAAFFDEVVLGEADAPYVELHTMQEVGVIEIGPDGGVPSQYAVKDMSRIPGRLQILSTKAYTYPLVDLYTGKVADNAKAQVDLGYDLGMQVNAILWPVVTAAAAAFTLSGSNPALYTYNLHSSIDPDNIPTTNLLVADSNGGATKFRKNALDKIITYAAGWMGTDAEEGMRLVAIHLPSRDITGMLTETDLTSRGDNTLVQQIFTRGYIYDYGGQMVTLIADPTLDYSAAYGYVQFARGIGNFWTKPSMDKMLTTAARASVQAQLVNEEQMLQCKVIGAMAIEPLRRHVARISYRTTA